MKAYSFHDLVDSRFGGRYFVVSFDLRFYISESLLRVGQDKLMNSSSRIYKFSQRGIDCV